MNECHIYLNIFCTQVRPVILGLIHIQYHTHIYLRANYRTNYNQFYPDKHHQRLCISNCHKYQWQIYIQICICIYRLNNQK